MSEQQSSDPKPQLALIVAAAENGVIGRDGGLPWRLPADLARFKRLTMGHAMIMGRKTYESIGRPLPGRVSIVLTRDENWRPEHDKVLVANTLEAAREAASRAEGVEADEAFVIGGGEIYRLALPGADRVELTRVRVEIDGDTSFPELQPHEWELTSTEERPADDRNEHACTFEVWERVRN
ncbi:MAG: dihydrofolate reductase [Planctomycetota bacterium]